MWYLKRFGSRVYRITKSDIFIKNSGVILSLCERNTRKFTQSWWGETIGEKHHVKRFLIYDRLKYMTVNIN